MSDELASIAHDAGELLRYAITPRESPFQNRRYSELIDRLRTSPTFETVFENMAEGLEIAILYRGHHGVFVAGKERSPFSLNLDDYKSGMSAEVRVVHGLVMLAIAAYCFPTIEVLDQEEDVMRPPITVRQVVDFIQGLCKLCKNKSPGDPEAGSRELELAWQTIQQMPAMTPLKGRDAFAAGCLAGTVSYALDRLVDYGMMTFQERNETNWGVYKPTPRYRVQVKRLAAHETLKLIQGAQQQMPKLEEGNPNG